MAATWQMSSGGVVLNTMSGSYNVKNPAFGGDDSSRYGKSQITTNGHGHPFGAKAGFSVNKPKQNKQTKTNQNKTTSL